MECPVSLSTESNQRMVLISENFEFMMPLHVKNQILTLIKNESTSTRVFRQLVKSIISDENVLAENNKDSIMQKYPILNACIGLCYIKFQTFKN